MILLTTTVGSFPKPEYLKKARTKFYAGEMSKEELHKLEQKATRDVIKRQEEVGLDILVDGEFYRGDMATYFAENLKGAKISGLVRSYGNRYYRKPIINGKLERPNPITIDWFKFAQGLTSKPIKGMLTGPYTMMDWSFNEYYPSREALAMAFADVLLQEALELEKAGAKYIQIDEPALSVRADELDIAFKAVGHITKHLKAKTISHMCYGSFEKIYPKLLEMPIDQIDIEMANSDYDMLELFKKYPFTKEIGLGVVDVHSHTIEPKELIIERIKRVLDLLPAEKIYVDPDCGLKTRTEEEAFAKLKNMVLAVQEVRKELQLV